VSGFGMFEANVTSDAEEKRHVREAANQLAAATYDVRERFGQFLFGSKDLSEYTDRLALSKNDILKTIEPHVFPRTGTVRRVLKPLEDEFKSRQTRTASRRTAAPLSDERSRIVPSKTTAEDYVPPASSSGSERSTIVPSQTTAQDYVPASSAGSPTAGGGADGSGWSPNSATDSIGAGNYNIQSGDTLTSISERAGLGADGVKSLAEANGISNPDMIYAGDDLKIPGSSSSSTSTTSTSPGLDATGTPSTPSAPLPAEAGGPAPTSGTPGVPPVPSVGVPGDLAALTSDPRTGRRAASRRRYADFNGTLEPEGDFKGYLSDVDEGDEGRTTNNFGGTFPGGTDHNGDPADTDFVKSSTRHFALWCKANRRLASLDSLEAYAPSDREYVAIAATLQRVAASGVPGSTPTGPEWNSKGKPKLNKPTKPGKIDMPELPGIGAPMGSMPGNKSAAAGDHWTTVRPSGGGPRPSSQEYPISIPGHGRHALESNWDGYGEDPYSYGDENEITLLPRQQVKKSIPKHRAEAGKHDTYFPSVVMDAYGNMGDVADPPELVGDPSYRAEPPMMKRVKGQPAKHRAPKHRARRRTAAPDYLQKADEALTNLLNQKAEEFQGQIAPLQQALQTVQQAEQAAQAASPMGVMPPAGTVNVMPQAPGGDPSGGGGMDPTALAAMMGGGDPSAGGGNPMMGGDPNAVGGGAPPGLDPNAMGGAPPAAQDQGLPPMMAARRRFARLHQAKNCECWDGYCRVPGTKPCAEGSCEKCDTHRKEGRRRYAEMPGGGASEGRIGDYFGFGGGTDGGATTAPEAIDPMDDTPSEWGGVLPALPPSSGPHEARRRSAKNVEDMWQDYVSKETQRGGEPDVDAFAQRYKVGPIALKRIRMKMSADNRKRGGQGKGRRASAHTSTRRQAWSGWGGASLSMKRVAGWDFDHRLNGYITAAADTFSCDCGENFSTPSGYRKCGSCGRAWNSYVIGTDSHGKEASLEKVICREIPVRKDVIVASKRTAKGGYNAFEEWSAWPGSANDIHGQALRNFADHGEYLKDPEGWWQSHSPEAGWGANTLHTDFPFIDKVNGKDTYNPNWLSEKKWTPYGGGQFVKREASRRTADPNGQYDPEWDAPKWRFSGEPGDYGYSDEKQQQAWEGALQEHGYEHKPMSRYGPSHSSWVHPENEQRIPAYPWDGWSPGQPFVSPKPNARTPQTFGEPWMNYTMLKEGDKHTLRRIDLRDMMDQEPEEDKPDIEHFASRRAAAITYVARCQRAGRRPTPHGLRRFMGSQQPKNQSLYDHYINDTGPNFPGKTVVDFTDPQWQTKTNWDGSRYDADGSPVFPFVDIKDRIKGKPYFIVPEHAHPTKGWYRSQDYIEHRQTCPTCSSGKRHASRRRAEQFDITEEGGTPKGKGKPDNRKTMRQNPKNWTEHRQNGQFTKKWAGSRSGSRRPLG